jgi:arylsulfatase A-like enzyme
VTEPVSNIDIAPTLCQVGGCTLGPYGDGRTAPDGRSFLHLISRRNGSMRRDALLESHPLAWQNEMPGWFAVRTTHRSQLGRWHYVEYEDGTRELYDLQADPFELENAAGKPESAAVEAALSTQLARLMAENPVPSPSPSPTASATPTGGDPSSMP